MVLVPVRGEHVAVLRGLVALPQVRARWRDVEPDWPLEDPTVVAFTVLREDDVVGFAQYGEESDPDYRHASVDLVLDPADNTPAVRCCAAVGFRPVGLMRRYERDLDGVGWHDGLLMELLADDLSPRPVGGAP